MQVLLINAQAEFSFWTMPEASKFARAKTPGPPLGLITAAALLPAEWQLRLVDLNTGTLSEDDWRWADLVMVSGMLAQRSSFLGMVREAKRRGKTVVVGGPYPTSIPRDAVDAGADFVVRGEGETTIPLLLEALKTGEKKIIAADGERPDLSTSPVPRFDLLHMGDYQFLQIQTSRGCPFNCEFCDIVSLFGRKPRYKTPEQVIGELETLYRLGHRGQVFVADDNFIGSKSHARSILERLITWNKERGEPFGFFTQTSVNIGQDTELIDLMTAANFGQVFLGIESPDEKVLYQSRKYQNLARPLLDSIETLNKNGLTVHGSFVIGFDGEKKAVSDRICALVEAANIPIVMINLLFALPGTNLWNRLEKEGRLLQDMESSDELVGDRMNFVPARPVSELREEFFQIWDTLYEPSRFLARVYRYYLHMRPTRRALALSKGEPVPRRVPRGSLPLTKKLQRLWGLIRLVWLQGIRSPDRFQFWGQAIGMLRHNPSRISAYFVSCALGEDMFQVRQTLRQKRSLMNRKEEQAAASTPPKISCGSP